MVREGKMGRRAACLVHKTADLVCLLLSGSSNSALLNIPRCGAMSDNSFSKRKNTKLKTRKFPSVVIWAR